MKAVTIAKPIGWIRIGLYGILLTGIFYSSHRVMVSWWERDDYNYAYLIPFVVLYLIWEKRRKFSTVPSSSSWLGIIPLIIGICFYWLGELGGEYLTLYISSWLLLLGICWMHLGWRKLKIIGFPLFFILTMFPLPNFLYYKITAKLQLISSQLGVALIRLYGMSAFREGNVIDLGFTQLQVVEACSGLRYLISLAVLGLLMAYFFRAALWKRALLFLSVVPLSIFTNSFRIAITGILYEGWGAKVAEGFFHGFSGLVIFLFCLPILLVEMWVLKKAVGKEQGARSKSKGIETENSRFEIRNLKVETGESKLETGHLKLEMQNPSESSNPKQETNKGLRSLFTTQFIVIIFLLGTTLALSQGIEFREKIPIKRPLNQFLLELDGWSGVREAMDQKFIKELDLSDYVIIDYHNKDGKSVNFYVAYYESQRKGESIHSPDSCLPGSGWVFEQAGQTMLSIPGYEKGTFLVNRAYMQKGVYKQLSYYWFAQRGRILTSAYELKLFVFWDALTKQRTDGALVRLITPVGEYEKLEDAEERLQAFTGKIVPILDQYIPGKNIK